MIIVKTYAGEAIFANEFEAYQWIKEFRNGKATKANNHNKVVVRSIEPHEDNELHRG
jgi:hypothetical protein